MLKGYGRTFEFTGAFEVFPSERKVRFLSFPDEEHVGVYKNGTVELSRKEGGIVVASTDNHRGTFAGLGKLRRWAPVDALYFFGYALSHYHSLPFTLLEARLLSLTRTSKSHCEFDVLEVEFPPEFPTHCRRQSFYIDKVGRIARHDYVADIVGFWARGAHFWKQEVHCNGFPVCLERHVLARIGRSALPVTALRATFVEVEVN